MTNNVWVFDSAKLAQALQKWKAEQGDLVGRDDLDMVITGIEHFLDSPQAAKLRVHPNQRPLALG